MINVALRLGIEELALVEIHGISLGFATFRGGQMFLAAELLRQFFAALPLHEHSADFVADQLALLSGFGEIEFFTGCEDGVVLPRLRAKQAIKLGKVFGVE